MRIVLDWFNRNRLRLRVVDKCYDGGIRCMHCRAPVFPIFFLLERGAENVYLCDCGEGVDLREKYAILSVWKHQRPYSYYRREALKMQKALSPLGE